MHKCRVKGKASSSLLLPAPCQIDAVLLNDRKYSSAHLPVIPGIPADKKGPFCCRQTALTGVIPLLSDSWLKCAGAPSIWLSPFLQFHVFEIYLPLWQIWCYRQSFNLHGRDRSPPAKEGSLHFNNFRLQAPLIDCLLSFQNCSSAPGKNTYPSSSIPSLPEVMFILTRVSLSSQEYVFLHPHPFRHPLGILQAVVVDHNSTCLSLHAAAFDPGPTGYTWPGWGLAFPPESLINTCRTHYWVSSAASHPCPGADLQLPTKTSVKRALTCFDALWPWEAFPWIL